MSPDRKPHSLADVLDGTVDPAVLAHLEAGHPIYYFCSEIGSVVEERPDGTIWRVRLKAGGVIEYLDERPVDQGGDPSLSSATPSER
jgi:hypothetical protein